MTKDAVIWLCYCLDAENVRQDALKSVGTTYQTNWLNRSECAAISKVKCNTYEDGGKER